MSSILKAYTNLLKRFPLTVQSLQTGTLMGAGDIISQFTIEKRKSDQYEWMRTARFFAIGTLFVGPILGRWYGILDRKIGSGTAVKTMKKVGFDQGLFAPCFLGAFLTVNGVTQSQSVKEIQENIKNNYTDILLTNWMFWPVVQICNFAIVPLHYQVLVVQMFALFWNTYLAYKTNQ